MYSFYASCMVSCVRYTPRAWDPRSQQSILDCPFYFCLFGSCYVCFKPLIYYASCMGLPVTNAKLFPVFRLVKNTYWPKIALGPVLVIFMSWFVYFRNYSRSSECVQCVGGSGGRRVYVAIALLYWTRCSSNLDINQTC